MVIWIFEEALLPKRLWPFQLRKPLGEKAINISLIAIIGKDKSTPISTLSFLKFFRLLSGKKKPPRGNRGGKGGGLVPA